MVGRVQETVGGGYGGRAHRRAEHASSSPTKVPATLKTVTRSGLVGWWGEPGNVRGCGGEGDAGGSVQVGLVQVGGDGGAGGAHGLLVHAEGSV